MQINHRSDLNLLLKEYNMLDNVAEIGVAEGRYSLEILNWGVKKLYLVDIWETMPFYGDAAFNQNWHDKNYKEVQERVQDFKDKVIFLKGLSVDMAIHIEDKSLGMVYLDACHTYEAVLKDLTAYLPKLRNGGIMAGHDFLGKDYGVEQAVIEFGNTHNFKINTIPENSPENASFWFQKS